MSSSHFWPRLLFGALFVVITFLTLTPNPVESEPGFALTRFLSSMLLETLKTPTRLGTFWPMVR